MIAGPGFESIGKSVSGSKIGSGVERVHGIGMGRSDRSGKRRGGNRERVLRG